MYPFREILALTRIKIQDCLLWTFRTHVEMPLTPSEHLDPWHGQDLAQRIIVNGVFSSHTYPNAFDIVFRGHVLDPSSVLPREKLAGRT